MSMAVIDDSPVDENYSESNSESVREPTFLEIVSRQSRLRLRQLWRYIAIALRSVFWLEEDSQRDQMIMSNRADIEFLTSQVAHAMSGINLLNERLSAHEEAIPRMRAVKEQFDNTRRVEKEKRDAAIETKVKDQAELEERRAVGILT
jgi:hypothetical protein